MTSTKPAKKARASYHHGDLARELIQASLEILKEVGAEALSLREAARRVGVNHRAVYRHYEDKRALLAAIAEAGYRALSADMQEAVNNAGASETGTERARLTLTAIAEAYLRFALREPARYQVMFGPRLNRDDRFPELERVIQELVAVLFRELKAAGPGAPTIVLRDHGISLWSTMHGMSSLVLAGRIPLRSHYVRSYVAKVVGPVVEGILIQLRG